jgi:dolichyl-phosphate-mannose--protein O-mannosyl transferase
MTTELFEDKRAGWLAAAFMAVDGFYLAYSRSGLGDMLLSCLMQWAVFAAVAARGWAGVVTSAVLIGLSASIKWVGLLAGLPSCLAIVVLRRVPWYSMVSYAVVPVVHLLVWMLGLHMIHLPNDPISVFNTIMVRKDIHLGFPHHKNPLESPWYSWPVLYHPIVIKSAQLGGKIRVASSVAHPLLCFAADACLAALPVLGSVAALRPGFRERLKTFFDSASTKGVVILGASWLSAMLLWMSGKIVIYWYHYLTAWGFAIMLLAGILSRFERRYPKAILGFVIAVVAVAIWFVPVWAEFPLSRQGMVMRLPFALWR